MEHAQREATLRARDLVVIELHGIDGAAAKFVVLRIRSEDRTQQNASAISFWMNIHMFLGSSVLGGRFLRGDVGHITKILHAIKCFVEKQDRLDGKRF